MSHKGKHYGQATQGHNPTGHLLNVRVEGDSMTQAGPKQRITVDVPWELYEKMGELTQSRNAFVVAAIAEKLERDSKPIEVKA